MPLQATSGAASYDAFGGGVPYIPQYIEEVFSTWLYTGNGTTQTITNGIDLAGKGGLVWIKSRSAATANYLQDTVRGVNSALFSDQTSAAINPSGTAVSSFNANGWTIGANGNVNTSAATYASWTFREQPKFFDVVTWTGNGANRTIAHNLGSVPGCIIVKRTDATANWQVYHRSLANTQYMVLNTTAAVATGATRWNSTTPTSTVFSLGTDATVNASGGTYVAYIYAHNAGGFGLTGTDNVISCGSFITDGSGDATVNLGYEPQWVMSKTVTTVSGFSDWYIVDSLRGNPTLNGTSNNEQYLYANQSAAEATTYGVANPTSTGFVAADYPASETIIYIAIRRGPMKVPTTGTSVFGLNARTGTGANVTVTGSAGVSDAVLIKNRGAAVGDLFASRLTGTGYLETSSTAAGVAAGTTILQANPWDVMDGVKVGTTSTITNASANTYINYLFDRAPGFFDVCCYTGTGVDGRVVNHNLTVAPELIIYKVRNAVTDWCVGASAGPFGFGQGYNLNTAGAPFNAGNALTSVGASTYSVGAVGFTNSANTSGSTYVAYLFATCPGVSKVGSYTGNGSSQTINCGFTGGARFVLIRRTDSTGDWYVWDTARGIVAGNDPYIVLNTAAAEVTTNDTVDTDTTGFVVNQLAATNVNVTSATYIFLAIA